ncbi:YfbU family protein [Aeromonas veronii]|uniref:YfbU family protein n=1 Tax=Aeromonas veronii TaxID=654 RepID=UPI000E1ECB7C|nr:YfbU family protein [Aeromonas veronii]RDU80944.1 hypothetical protein CHF44_12955 [Aeromonas veronii]RDU88353.1 hypothetical protein CHH34_20560 [Aeromonas veronii]
MNFTPEQRLIVGLLCDIHQKLEIRNSFDPEMITDAIQTGNEWAIDLEYGEYLGSEITDPRFTFVSDVLNMCSIVEFSYSQLSEEEKTLVAAGTRYNPANAFYGFDGNNEGAYMSAARFYVTRTNRFQEFTERDFNSHTPSVPAYERMLRVFNEVHDPIHGNVWLGANQIVAIMNERVHPDNR